MIVLWGLLVALGAAVVVLLVRTALFRPRLSAAVAPQTVAVDGAFAADALSALVCCKTISHADPAEDDEAEFVKLVGLLPALFPKVHAVCEWEQVGPRGLLFRWAGQTTADPLVLTAHYDVVPVADAAVWDVPPFSGEIRDGILHGRGTLDTKCTMAAALTAVETLIAQGYTPARDVYLCFAGDEEVMGSGASGLVDALEKRGVRPLCVLDEGGAIVENVFPGVKQPCALVGVAEKGSVNYTLQAKAKGGHSSAPLPKTPVDMLARACVRLLGKPFPFRVTKAAQLLLDGLARHSTFAYRLIFANLWAFAPVLDVLCQKSGGELNALFRTTLAYTMFHGGDAANVLPPTAEMTINARVLPGETIEGTLQAIQAKVNDDAHVEVRLLKGLPPSGCSGTDGAGFAALRRAVGEVYPGVLVSPYLMIACSDARHYERICAHVYRFSGMPLTATERRMIHGANEQIPVAKQVDTVRFYMRFICGVNKE